jgi:hypothetical protein
VVRETVSIGGGTSLSFPMLKRGEYVSWAMVMEVNLQAAQLWDAVEDDDVPRHQDKQALAALLRSTPSEMHCMLIGKGSAKAAWEAIRVQHQGTDRVRDTRVRRLRTEFETISFKDGERIDDFGLRITNLASTLRSLGDLCDEEKVVRKFLTVVPKDFVQIAFSMETLMDPATMTVEEVVGHLRAVEERLSGEQSSAGGQLLLTEKQWEERKKGRAGGSSSNGATGGGAPRKGGTPPQRAPAPATGAPEPDRNKCHYCGKKGHWARDCRKKKMDEEAQAHLVQHEDDADPALLMAVRIPDDVALALDGRREDGVRVFLNEDRARVQLRGATTTRTSSGSWTLARPTT